MNLQNNILSILLHTEQLATSFELLLDDVAIPDKTVVKQFDEGFYEIKVHPVKSPATAGLIKKRWNEHLNYIGALDASEQISRLYKRIEQDEKRNLTIKHLNA